MYKYTVGRNDRKGHFVLQRPQMSNFEIEKWRIFFLFTLLCLKCCYIRNRYYTSIFICILCSYIDLASTLIVTTPWAISSDYFGVCGLF